MLEPKRDVCGLSFVSPRNSSTVPFPTLRRALTYPAQCSVAVMLHLSDMQPQFTRIFFHRSAPLSIPPS